MRKQVSLFENPRRCGVYLGHILWTLFADNIHKEGFCGKYRTKRDFADALDNRVIIALKDTDVLFLPVKVFCLQISTVLNRKSNFNFEIKFLKLKS